MHLQTVVERSHLESVLLDTLTDHVLSHFLSLKDCSVINVNITDHYPVSFSNRSFMHALTFIKTIFGKEEFDSQC